MMNVSDDRGRITARVSTSVEEKLKEAADLLGATVNQFLVQAALEKANNIIDRERLIKISREDAAILINMLKNPSKANTALTRAFERFENKAENESSSNTARHGSPRSK